MHLVGLLELSKEGLHPACEGCPWNPRKVKSAFGVSCQEHGADVNFLNTALSILIAQDPAGTTPEKTGRLCAVCNSLNATDKTAQHSFDLWKAAVSLAQSGQSSLKYLDRHYWTNAVMHGYKDTALQEARTHCKYILREQICVLSPHVIIATGKVAADSLYDLKVISRPWDSFAPHFHQQVYREKTLLPSGNEVTIFCTFHGSARTVNTHAAWKYTETVEVLLNRRIEQLPDPISVKWFLSKYPKEVPEGRGMRVLLLHWLEIGEVIRQATLQFTIGSIGRNGKFHFCLTTKIYPFKQ